ncbi:MAG: NF038143 family protein [Deltaproteobacteria bacterium]|nr:NF038143 family protein [Deltaproteobacteria bacterium]
MAKAVAKAVIGLNPITAWDIMLPLVFLYNFLRFKKAREIFTINYLFTKKLALEAAFDMIKKSQSKEEVIARIKDKTSNTLAADKKGIYSIKIRQRQMKEIDLLIDHYYKLLNAEGKDYASMVKNAYQTKKHYTAFLGQLKRDEKEVNKAARRTLSTPMASEIVAKMEETTDRIRMAEVEKIFRTNERVV